MVVEVEKVAKVLLLCTVCGRKWTVAEKDGRKPRGWDVCLNCQGKEEEVEGKVNG